MTSWANESQAIRNMIEQFGGEGKAFACVMDSYDYVNALSHILPAIIKQKTEKGGLMVLRPDSGDPSESVLLALTKAETVVGATVNKKGYKLLKGLSVIQGDGVNYNSVRHIIETYLKAGYSAANVAFGMGGGLLQKVNRDTMSFATKLSYIKSPDGHKRDIMKKPKSDASKISLPGILKVKRVNGVPTVFPSSEEDQDPENIFQTLWDNGPVVDHKWETFDQLRERVQEGWKTVPKLYDPVSADLKHKIAEWVKNFDENYKKLISAE